MLKCLPCYGFTTVAGNFTSSLKLHLFNRWGLLSLWLEIRTRTLRVLVSNHRHPTTQEQFMKLSVSRADLRNVRELFRDLRQANRERPEGVPEFTNWRDVVDCILLAPKHHDWADYQPLFT